MGRTGVTGGPEAEYNAEYGLASDFFPLELLTRGMAEPLETRAAIDGDARATQGTWLDRLFSESAAARLGVTMPEVAPGIANYPVMTAGGNPVQRQRAEAASAQTFTVAVTELKPTRKAVHAIYSIEDNGPPARALAEGIARDMRARYGGKGRQGRIRRGHRRKWHVCRHCRPEHGGHHGSDLDPGATRSRARSGSRCSRR